MDYSRILHTMNAITSKLNVSLTRCSHWNSSSGNNRATLEFIKILNIFFFFLRKYTGCSEKKKKIKIIKKSLKILLQLV